LIATISKRRYRSAVDSFRPDCVAITDTWNMKPLLAEAMRGYPCLLLYQAQENLCPLNNLRLLADGPDQVRQCPRNQLATPEVCHRCLAERGHHSGALHQYERALAGVGTCEYDQKLRRSLQEAEAVLVLNPHTAVMLEPYASRIRIVPWGLDPARFPWPPPDEPPHRPSGQVATLFMPAVANEYIKGFMSLTKRVGSCVKRGLISSWWSRSIRRGPAQLTSSRGRSAGARRPSCRAITGRPIFAWCRRSPRTG
jgi:hypothetical protein